MQRIGVTEARRELGRILDEVADGQTRVVLERRGRPAAGLVTADEVRLLEWLEDRIDLELAYQALDEAEREGTIAWEDLRAELGLA